MFLDLPTDIDQSINAFAFITLPGMRGGAWSEEVIQPAAGSGLLGFHCANLGVVVGKKLLKELPRT